MDYLSIGEENGLRIGQMSNIVVRNVDAIKRKPMKALNIIFPNQLFENNPLLDNENDCLLIEEYLFFTQFNFHKQKLLLHRSSMKRYEQLLLSKNKEVIYINCYEKIHDIRLLLESPLLIKYSKIRYIDTVDYWLEKRIALGLKNKNIEIEKLDNPNFINTPNDLELFFRTDKKKYFQTKFYTTQREKYNILLKKDGKPVGDKWTYDSENRKKYPKNKTAPKIAMPKLDSLIESSIEYINNNFPNNIGDIKSDKINYAFSHDQAKQWLTDFIDKRFNDFGPYEDAIVSDEIFLNHSILTPMLNIGLLSPQEIINKAIIAYHKDNIPINSVEGFVRQILGWREFMRGMYITKGREQRTSNFWKFSKKIPPSFYNATTGIKPVDDTINKVLETGYCHHIERLMILGNFMLLCEFDPKEVYRWFMEMFVDAYDWVMVPNVFGMSQFADGGLLSTKPYISGSNYILKMSNYKKDDWCQVWDGLFWRFMDKYREFFLKNPRIGMLVRTFDKMDISKQESHLKFADSFLNNL